MAEQVSPWYGGVSGNAEPTTGAPLMPQRGGWPIDLPDADPDRTEMRSQLVAGRGANAAQPAGPAAPMGRPPAGRIAPVVPIDNARAVNSDATMPISAVNPNQLVQAPVNEQPQQAFSEPARISTAAVQHSQSAAAHAPAASAPVEQAMRRPIQQPAPAAAATSEPPAQPAPRSMTSPTTGPETPHAVGVRSLAGGLRSVSVHAGAAPVWVVGAHGGAGETSLAGLDPTWADMRHHWPRPEPGSGRCAVLLCARTNSAGAQAAQVALTQWASGEVTGIDLLGLVWIADAPPKPPKPLRDLMHVVSGGAPRTWKLPWIPEWRLGEPTASGSVTDLIKQVSALVDSPTVQTQSAGR